MSSSKAASLVVSVAAVSRASRASPIASSSRLFSSTPSPSAVPSFSSPSRNAPSSPTNPSPNLFEPIEYPELPPLPRPHGIHVATLQLASYHTYKLDLYTTFAYHSARSLNIPTTRATTLPNHRQLVSVIKSPFVHKKKQEVFMRIEHKRMIKAYDASRETLDLWLRYLKVNGIGGVGIRARVHEFVDFGFGRKEVEGVEKQFEGLGGGGIGSGSGGVDEGEVQRVAEELIKKLSGEVDALASEEASEEHEGEGEGETGIVDQVREAAEHSDEGLKTKTSESGMATAASVDAVVESQPVNKVDKDGKEIEGSAEEMVEVGIPEHPTLPTPKKTEAPAEKKDTSLAAALLEEAEEEVVRPTEGVKAKTGNPSEQKDEAKAAAAEVGTLEPKV